MDEPHLDDHDQGLTHDLEALHLQWLGRRQALSWLATAGGAALLVGCGGGDSSSSGSTTTTTALVTPMLETDCAKSAAADVRPNEA